MFEVYMLQPTTEACDLLGTTRRGSYVSEPDLNDLMEDPMTLAVMAADGVSRCELTTLLARARRPLVGSC